jgi:hypothetical protein
MSDPALGWLQRKKDIIIIIIIIIICLYLVQDSSISIWMGYGLDGRGANPGRFNTLFSSPKLPKRPWDPPSFLHSGYRALYPWVSNGRGMKLTIKLYLVPRSRMVELYLHYPTFIKAWCLTN